MWVRKTFAREMPSPLYDNLLGYYLPANVVNLTKEKYPTKRDLQLGT